jgi:hypothetical protein
MYHHLMGLRGPGRYVPPTGGGGEGDPGTEEPPVVTIVDGDTTITGKIKPGSFGKVIVPLSTLAAGRKYTFRVVANFSQLAKQGKLAMVGAAFKTDNSFHITGLRGDGAAGTDEYIVHGATPNGWNKLTGHTEVNGGDAASGTQHSAYYQLTISSDGASYALATGTDGVAWTTIFTGQALTPFSNVSAVTQFGVGLWFNNTDAGVYHVVVSEFVDEVAATPDPDFANVVLLVGFNGADASTVFTDESNSAHTITTNGGAQVDTAQSQFGGSSGLFDTIDDFLSIPDSADWALSAANSDEFTVEAWVRYAVDQGGMIVGQRGATVPATTHSWALIRLSTDKLFFSFDTPGGSNVTVTETSATQTLNAWRHVAVDKDAAGKIRLYNNGVMVGSATPADSSFRNSTNILTIGRASTTIFDFDGHINELRITKGVARYASDGGFSVPTEAFPRL